MKLVITIESVDAAANVEQVLDDAPQCRSYHPSIAPPESARCERPRDHEGGHQASGVMWCGFAWTGLSRINLCNRAPGHEGEHCDPRSGDTFDESAPPPVVDVSVEKDPQRGGARCQSIYPGTSVQCNHNTAKHGKLGAHVGPGADDTMFHWCGDKHDIFACGLPPHHPGDHFDQSAFVHWSRHE